MFLDFVVFYFVSPVPTSQQFGRQEHLRNDLFRVEWDLKFELG